MNVHGTPNCYYLLVPPANTEIDPSGYVKGDALQGTRGYERLVDMLADHGNTSSPAQDLKEAQTAVDKMKLKAGATLVARCHPGYTAADHRNPASYVNGNGPGSDTPVNRSPRSLAMSDFDTGRDNHPTREYVNATSFHDLSFWDKVITVMKDVFSGGDKDENDDKPFDVNAYQRELDAFAFATATKKFGDTGTGEDNL